MGERVARENTKQRGRRANKKKHVVKYAEKRKNTKTRPSGAGILQQELVTGE